MWIVLDVELDADLSEVALNESVPGPTFGDHFTRREFVFSPSKQEEYFMILRIILHAIQLRYIML